MKKSTKKTTKPAEASRLEGTVPAAAAVTEVPVAAVEQPVAAVVEPTATEPTAPEATPALATAEPIKPTREATAREDATVYTVTGDLDPKRKGLVVKVHRTLKTLGSGTAAQVADAVVASGEWTSKAVAVVPVRVWLKEFVEKGIATVA